MDPNSTHASAPGDAVKRRVAVLFCGFEPLDAEAQRIRFQRTAAQTATQWNCKIETGALAGSPAHPYFDVVASGPDWRTETRFYLMEHSSVIATLRKRSLPIQIARGFGAFLNVIAEGGLFGYFRWAWRFALFFLFPFLLMLLALAVTAGIALIPFIFDLSPLHLIWSLPAAFGFFRYLFLPRAERLHTMLLFSNWQLALAMARQNNENANRRLEEFYDGLREAFSQPADEYLVASHSMGTNWATHTFGTLLEREPELAAGKKVAFLTLGGALLQCGLLRSAKRLRERAKLILGAPNVTWFEVQCLTDPVNFYKAPVAKALGHADVPQPEIVQMRVRRTLTREHYKRIKYDILRVHRQYVMGSDLRVPHDFGLMVAGPLPAASFVGYSYDQLPPIAEDGSVSGR